MNIDKIITEVIPSTDMRDYLIAHSAKLSQFQIADMILGAELPLTRKSEIMEVLAKNEKGIAAKSENHISFAEHAENLHHAVEELTLKPGELFLLSGYYRDEKDGDCVLFETIPFLDCEKAVQYIQSEYEPNGREAADNLPCWYVLEKWVKEDNEHFTETTDWLISANGKICYVYNRHEYHMEYWINPDLNLPVPYRAGDIVRVDCRPFAMPKNVLIVDTGDNTDCCSLQALYLKENGKYALGALKHGPLFKNRRVYPCISPLYRIQKLSSEETEAEFEFRIISEFLNGNSKKGTALEQYIYENCDKKEYQINFESIVNDFITKYQKKAD